MLCKGLPKEVHKFIHVYIFVTNSTSNLVDLVYRPLNLQGVRYYNEEGNGRIGSALALM